MPSDDPNAYGWRLEHLEELVARQEDEIRGLTELHAAQGERLAALRESQVGLREELKDARAGVRTLVMVLVGFAFTVAGSAVTLALTLGGPS